MFNKRQIRKFHKYLGVIAGIQLFIWTLSGLFFALIPIEEIRGTHLIKAGNPVPIGDFIFVSPSQLVSMHPELKDLTLSKVKLAKRLGSPVYLISMDKDIEVYDAVSGKKMTPISREEAMETGYDRSKLPIVSAEYVQEVEAGSEYRGGELPVWQLLLEDESHLYIGARSGQLRAVRTNDWRLYDFLWGLHIMDYKEREDFNHWLLKIAAAFAVITVLTGIAVFVSTLKRRRINTIRVKCLFN